MITVERFSGQGLFAKKIFQMESFNLHECPVGSLGFWMETKVYAVKFDTDML